MITTYWRQAGNEPWQPITRDQFTHATQDAGHGGYYYINGIAYKLRHEHGQVIIRSQRQRRQERQEH